MWSDRQVLPKTIQFWACKKVLDERSSQETAFNESCTGLLEGVLSDRNSCLFTYGASGSGKTYTIMGGPGEKAGIIPRAMESIFNSLSPNIYTKTDIRPSGSAYISRVGLAEERRWNKIKTNLINQDSEPISGDWNKPEKSNRRRSSFLSPIEVLQGIDSKLWFDIIDLPKLGFVA